MNQIYIVYLIKINLENQYKHNIVSVFHSKLKKYTEDHKQKTKIISNKKKKTKKHRKNFVCLLHKGIKRDFVEIDKILH